MLNDGGVATYTGGSGTAALTFSYTVAAGQNTADLTVSSYAANGATLVGVSSGAAANLSGAVTNPAGVLQIDTSVPTVTSLVASGTGITAGAGDLHAGAVVTLTANLSQAVTVPAGRRRWFSKTAVSQPIPAAPAPGADLQLHGGGRSEHGRPDGVFIAANGATLVGVSSGPPLISAAR